MGRVVLFLAWTALVLPWERCHADCHDHVRPAVAEHPCHEDTCCGEPAPASEPESYDHDHHHHDEADHERVDFYSLKPKFEQPLFLAPAAECVVEAPAAGPVAPGPERREVRSAVPGTVVLLL